MFFRISNTPNLAQQMREKAKLAYPAIVADQVEKILLEIDEAAKTGYRSLYTSAKYPEKSVLKMIMTALTKHGFKVEYDNSCQQEKPLKITW